MSHPEKTISANDRLVAYFRSGNAIRSRSLSSLALHDRLVIPQPPERLVVDWNREVKDLVLEIGDIESLSLARTIMRWPDYPRCAEAVAAWLQALGLPDLLDPSDLALMACRGTHYHHDAAQYGNAAFCNLFLSEDKGLDLHFASLGQRIPLTCGTVVIFDTAQPHAVIPRGSSGFDVAQFDPDQDCTQVFLTWELPIENAELARALQIDFAVDTAGSSQVDELRICLNGIPLTVCSETGRWRQADATDAEDTGARIST